MTRLFWCFVLSVFMNQEGFEVWAQRVRVYHAINRLVNGNLFSWFYLKNAARLNCLRRILWASSSLTDSTFVRDLKMGLLSLFDRFQCSFLTKQWTQLLQNAPWNTICTPNGRSVILKKNHPLVRVVFGSNRIFLLWLKENRYRNVYNSLQQICALWSENSSGNAGFYLCWTEFIAVFPIFQEESEMSELSWQNPPGNWILAPSNILQLRALQTLHQYCNPPRRNRLFVFLSW